MYCPACGEAINEGVRYCRHCGENVADQDTGVEEAEPIEHAARVEHQCESCGEMLRSGEPPCRHCGGMEIDTRPVEPTMVTDGSATMSPAPDAPTGQDPPGVLPTQTSFYVGAVLAVISVIVAPYVFVFVALPEAILGLFGKSIQNHLPEEARDNAYVSGSMLIMRWFGNFLILLFVLGVVLGVLLVL